VSDTVYCEHKYITQPTVTPDNAIVQALLDLTKASKSKQNIKRTSQFDAIEHLQAAFLPKNKLIPKHFIPEKKQTPAQAPRVDAPDQRVEVPPPRVRFSDDIQSPVIYNTDPRAPMDQSWANKWVPTPMVVRNIPASLILASSPTERLP
jgi:hypothetical protein